MTRMLQCLLLLALLVPRPEASASVPHLFLRSSQPAAGESLGVPPHQIRLNFSERVELAFTRVQLITPSGVKLNLGSGTLDPDSVGSIVVVIDSTLAVGSYQVVWQAAGDDSHVVRGDFTFVVASSAGATAQSASSMAEPAPLDHGPSHVTRIFDASHPLFVAVRWLMYLALMGVIGSVALQGIVLKRASQRRQLHGETLGDGLTRITVTIGRAAMMLLLVSLVLRLIAQWLTVHPPGEAITAGALGSMLFSTTWGLGWNAHGILALLGLAAFHRAERLQKWGLIRVIALLLVFTPALSGHAIASERLVGLAVLLDGVHVLGAASWLGTLAVMLVVGILSGLDRNDHAELAQDLVISFSPLALVAAGVVGISGVGSAWIHLGRFAELWTSAYGQVLLLKLTVLSVVAGTGAYNWRYALPRLGDRVGAARILRSSSLEVLVAVLVLFITAVLVALPTPLATP